MYICDHIFQSSVKKHIKFHELISVFFLSLMSPLIIYKEIAAQIGTVDSAEYIFCLFYI